MAELLSRHIAKFLGPSLFAAAIVFAPASGFAVPMPPLDEAVGVVSFPPAVAKTYANTEALEKEQAMSTAQLIDRFTPHIKEASRRFKISTDWIKAVIRVESGGRTLSDDNEPIASSAGALGIMQVMPETYRDMQQAYGLGGDPHDPRDNILAGTAYLQWLQEKYGFPKMFAAYNAGPATVEVQASKKGKLPKETRDYIKRISTILGIKEEDAPGSVEPPKKIIATLTRPNGAPVTIEGDKVSKIRAAFPNEFIGGVKTVVIMGERVQGVLEDLAAVTAALKAPRISAQYLPS